MSDTTPTFKLQQQLATYCRTGKAVEIQGTKPHRLPQYRRLVFTIIVDSLQQAYPITYDLLGDELFRGTVSHFFSTHSCTENEVWKMPHDFLLYAYDQKLAEKLNIPYLIELIELEWTEIEIFGMPDVAITYPVVSSIWHDQLPINPYLKILNFNYPIHKLRKKKNLVNKGNYFVLCYRDLDTLKVQFLEITSLGAVLLNALNDGMNLSQIIAQINRESNLEINENYRKNIALFIQDMIQRKVIPTK